MENNKYKPARVLLGGALLVLLLAAAAASLASAEQNKCDDKKALAECCPKDRKGPTGVTRNILEDLLQCIGDLWSALLSGNVKFPRSCCKLPVFNLICSRHRGTEFEKVFYQDAPTKS